MQNYLLDIDPELFKAIRAFMIEMYCDSEEATDEDYIFKEELVFLLDDIAVQASRNYGLDTLFGDDDPALMMLEELED